MNIRRYMAIVAMAALVGAGSMMGMEEKDGMVELIKYWAGKLPFFANQPGHSSPLLVPPTLVGTHPDTGKDYVQQAFLSKKSECYPKYRAFVETMKSIRTFDRSDSAVLVFFKKELLSLVNALVDEGSISLDEAVQSIKEGLQNNADAKALIKDLREENSKSSRPSSEIKFDQDSLSNLLRELKIILPEENPNDPWGTDTNMCAYHKTVATMLSSHLKSLGKGEDDYQKNVVKFLWEVQTMLDSYPSSEKSFDKRKPVFLKIKDKMKQVVELMEGKGDISSIEAALNRYVWTGELKGKNSFFRQHRKHLILGAIALAAAGISVALYKHFKKSDADEAAEEAVG